MEKSKIIYSSVKNRMRAIDPEIKVILFGSRARNDANESSDWDFLILTQYPVSRNLKNQINDELFEAELETDEVLTAIIANKNQWESYYNTPLFKNILKEGIEI
ncbi:MAG: nucleotidyltransferase domain-containing protein [Draconibacterium sp.]|jgi:predicted nucleotidyltransferase